MGSISGCGMSGMLPHCSSTPRTGGKKAGIHPCALQPPAEMMFHLFSPSRTFCHLQNVSVGLGLGCRARPTSPASSPRPVEHGDTHPAMPSEPGSDQNCILNHCLEMQREGEGQAGSCCAGSFPFKRGRGCGKDFQAKPRALKLSCCCKSSAAGPGEQLRQALPISRN